MAFTDNDTHTTQRSTYIQCDHSQNRNSKLHFTTMSMDAVCALAALTENTEFECAYSYIILAALVMSFFCVAGFKISNFHFGTPV